MTTDDARARLQTARAAFRAAGEAADRMKTQYTIAVECREEARRRVADAVKAFQESNDE